MVKNGMTLVETVNPEVRQVVKSKFKHGNNHYFVLVKEGDAPEFYIVGKNPLEEAIRSERVIIIG